MKRIFTMFLVAVLSLSLVACKKSTYEVDGVFTAFEVKEHSNGVPMFTWVNVTIKDGELESIYIDALQATVSDEGAFTWNDKSKKELGYDYRMHGPGMSDEDYKELLKEEGLFEWFEQAELIEAFFLSNGADAVEVDDENYIDNVTGVSIKDGGYTKLTKEALENAKNRVFLDFELNESGNPQVVWSEVTTNKKGEVTKVFLDTIQSAKTVTEEKTSFSWNEKSKKELGYGYRMHGPGMSDEEEYKELLKEEGLLEWFEQAELIEAFFLSNGAKEVDNVTGVSITTTSYTKVTKGAIAKIAK